MAVLRTSPGCVCVSAWSLKDDFWFIPLKVLIFSHQKCEAMRWKIRQHSVTVSWCLHDGRFLVLEWELMPQVLQTLVGGAGISPVVQKGGIHPSSSQEGGTDSPCRLSGHTGCFVRLCWFRAGGRQSWAGFGVRQWHPCAPGRPFPPLSQSPVSPLKGFRDNLAIRGI